MKKIIFLLFSSLCLAEFWEDERLIRALTTQTGYSLNEGERIIGIGPLAYGFTDRFMVRTNFLLDLILHINFECKYVIVKETNTIPAIALGTGYVNALWAQFMANGVTEQYKEDVESIKASLHSYLILLGISKRLSSKLIGHSSFNLAITEFKWDVKTKPDKSDPTSEKRKWLKEAAPTTNLTLGLEYEHSKKLRLLSNLGFDFSYQTPSLGAGIIWAPGKTTRIELGLFYPLFPHISIYWHW